MEFRLLTPSKLVWDHLYNPHTAEVALHVRFSWIVGPLIVFVGSLAFVYYNTENLFIPDCSSVWQFL
jgi:hypothetical protein